MNLKAMSITKFFGSLGAPLKNPMWSWGSEAPSGAIFLRVWQNEIEFIDGKLCVRLTDRHLFEGKKNLGYNERLSHIERIRQGAPVYCVFCEMKSQPTGDESEQLKKFAIKTFIKTHLFPGTHIVEHDGEVWLEFGPRLPVELFGSTAVSPLTPPPVFYDLIEALRLGQKQIPKILGATFRGVTNFMPGYWNVVGVTRDALAQMAAVGWEGEFMEGLSRDHMKSVKDFQSELMKKPCTYKRFTDLVADYGRCIICTKAQNTRKGAGFGTTYFEKDIIFLPQPFDTAQENSLRSSKTRAQMFASLLS
jgi:hypothetical protein